LGAFFAVDRKKPGFPLQVLGIAQDAWASSDFAKAKSRPAYAIPVGFPLQSLAHNSRTQGLSTYRTGS
jgi:hypothetical protein